MRRYSKGNGMVSRRLIISSIHSLEGLLTMFSHMSLIISFYHPWEMGVAHLQITSPRDGGIANLTYRPSLLLLLSRNMVSRGMIYFCFSPISKFMIQVNYRFDFLWLWNKVSVKGTYRS
jgi:hypothetical protein